MVSCNFAIHSTCSLELMAYKYSELQGQLQNIFFSHCVCVWLKKIKLCFYLRKQSCVVGFYYIACAFHCFVNACHFHYIKIVYMCHYFMSSL